jgi:LPS-assembly lipoprotein
MWLPDFPLRRLAALTLLLGLTGCFRPMYGELNGAPGVVDQLSRIDIQIADGRVGQNLRNELLYAFNSGNAPVDSAYRLTVSIGESTEDVILQRSGEAGTTFYELRANFTLIDAATGRVLHGGTAVSRTSFDRSTQIFANQRAKLDAENRAVKVIARTIRTRIAGYFAVNKEAAAARGS